VTKGIIYFSKQVKSRMVEISREDEQGVLRDIERIRSMIAREEIPRPNPERCGYCWSKSTASKRDATFTGNSVAAIMVFCIDFKAFNLRVNT